MSVLAPDACRTWRSRWLSSASGQPMTSISAARYETGGHQLEKPPVRVAHRERAGRSEGVLSGIRAPIMNRFSKRVPIFTSACDWRNMLR